MLDIDGMKAANDVYGHLRRSGAHCRERALSRRGLIGRYGGDEFIASCPGGRAGADEYRQEVWPDPEAASGTRRRARASA
jgi:GGDEF domain-containing protein